MWYQILNVKITEMLKRDAKMLKVENTKLLKNAVKNNKIKNKM